MVASCRTGAAAWQVWRVFDAQTAIVEGPVGALRVTQRASADSSFLVAPSWLLQAAVACYKGNRVSLEPINATVALCPPPWARETHKCAVSFSPFGESCVSVAARPLQWTAGNASVRWTSEGRSRRVVMALAALCLHVSADWLAEATTLHYTVGVTTGVVAMAVLVVALIVHVAGSSLAGRRNTARFRVATVTAFALGYFTMLWHYALEGLVSLVQLWPRLLAAYVCLSAGAAVAGTRVVLRSRVVPDFVRTVVRVAALLVAANSSRSATAGLAFVCGLVLHKSPFFDSAFVRGAWIALRRPSTSSPSFFGVDDEPAGVPSTNYLYGHRFLSEDEYQQEARDYTKQALRSLARSTEFADWLVKEHGDPQRQHRDNALFAQRRSSLRRRQQRPETPQSSYDSDEDGYY